MKVFFYRRYSNFGIVADLGTPANHCPWYVGAIIGAMREIFRKFAHWTSSVAGSPWAFAIAFVAIVIWALVGPLFDYSTNWQLWVNTGTTILTFLMVFLIQNTQNRDSHAIHLKLDELIRAIKSARNELIDIEDDTDSKLDELEREFEAVKALHPEIQKNHKM